MEYCDKCGYIKQQCECDKAEEIKLYKRSKVERLAIANTLLDGVAKDTEINLISNILNECMVMITDCIDVLNMKGE
jgi:hypothetical protein